MDTSVEKQPARSSTDFTLLLTRLEAGIIEGKKRSTCVKILSRKDIWGRLGPEEQSRWARLAQMAGLVDVALEILGHITRTNPKRLDAWEERLDLLSILDRKEELARVLAEAKAHLGREHLAPWAGGVSRSEFQDKDIQAATVPFDRLQHRQTVISHYLDLFSGREDYFARQWVDKEAHKQGYVPVRRSMQPEDVEAHLSGRKTYGIYLLRSDATVKTAVIDVDIAKQFRSGKLSSEDKHLIRRERDYLISRLEEVSQGQNLNPLIEFSGGKGFHFWFLFEDPLDAGEAKACLGHIADQIKGDLSAFNLEVFPKQAQLSGKGMGNLVKLPLGVHRLTGKRSFFTACHDRSTEAQLDFLMRIEPVGSAAIAARQNEQKQQKLLVHPRMKKWAEERPELYGLETLCPPLGQIIASCRQSQEITIREEKVLFQTIGFLPRGKSLLHQLLMSQPEYNAHLVDFKLSRLRGTPLGCKRIHSLLGFTGDRCALEGKDVYAHPLLHLKEWEGTDSPKAEKVENLQSALENLKLAVSQVQRFMK